MKKVLIISTSLRDGGNSDILASEFAKGACAAGHQTEIIDLEKKTIAYCRGCLSCQKTQRCVIQDDAEIIIQTMQKSDVIVFATPIYFYETCRQMMTLLDRTNPLYPSDYSFRDIYLLATAADEDTEAVDAVIYGLQGWIKCFDKTRLKGTLRGVGLLDPGAASETSEILQAAYKLGMNV